MNRWMRGAAAVLAVVLSLAVTGCSGRGHHHDHAHHYRHGYYNPVDGYFHDDHWHRQAHDVHRHGSGHAVSYHYY